MYAAEAKAMDDGRALRQSSARSRSTNFISTRWQRATTLHDQETKQVEFVRATGIHAQRLYVYDGAQIAQYGYYSPEQIRQDPSYGTQSNPKVWVMQEFKNSEANHLGHRATQRQAALLPPRHRRASGIHRREHDRPHAKDETIRVYTGNAFDVVGERKRTNYHVDSSQHWMDEIFEIRVRNHKKEAVERARGRAPVSLDQLEAHRAVARVAQDRRADHRVSRHRCSPMASRS